MAYLGIYNLLLPAPIKRELFLIVLALCTRFLLCLVPNFWGIFKICTLINLPQLLPYYFRCVFERCVKYKLIKTDKQRLPSGLHWPMATGHWRPLLLPGGGCVAAVRRLPLRRQLQLTVSIEVRRARTRHRTRPDSVCVCVCKSFGPHSSYPGPGLMFAFDVLRAFRRN